MQMRQLTNQIDQQNINLTSLSNQRMQTDSMLKQANEEIDELNRQLDENETIKLNQFAANEKHQREIQNLKSLLRRCRGFIDTHRDVFGDEANELDFDTVLADLDDCNLDYRLPESNLRHVFRPSRHFDFISQLGPIQ